MPETTEPTGATAEAPRSPGEILRSIFPDTPAGGEQSSEAAGIPRASDQARDDGDDKGKATEPTIPDGHEEIEIKPGQKHAVPKEVAELIRNAEKERAEAVRKMHEATQAKAKEEAEKPAPKQPEPDDSEILAKFDTELAAILDAPSGDAAGAGKMFKEFVSKHVGPMAAELAETKALVTELVDVVREQMGDKIIESAVDRETNAIAQEYDLHITEAEVVRKEALAIAKKLGRTVNKTDIAIAVGRLEGRSEGRTVEKPAAKPEIRNRDAGPGAAGSGQNAPPRGADGTFAGKRAPEGRFPWGFKAAD